MNFEPLDALIYDLEIRNCIQGNGEPREDGYRYCNGWGDYAGMGISVLVAYDCGTGNAYTYLRDNMDDFRDLVCRREYLIGFNSAGFDDKVLQAAGIHVNTTYDIYNEVRRAAGIKPGARVSGYKLNQICAANGLPSKSGDGADAPKWWQDRKYGKLINYCMDDCYLTRDLFYLSIRKPLIDPVTGMEIKLRSLFEGKHDGPQPRLDI